MPITELNYKIQLENYYGPLDLLLYLVKEAELDITSIALSKVAQQYIAFIESMQKLDIDLAGDFLAIASQLLLIKSRTLVPPEALEEEEEEEDPSFDLVRRLLEYKKFKDRARALEHLQEERSRRFGRPPLERPGEAPSEPLRNLELWDLVLVWSRLSKATRLDVSINILYHDLPIEIFIQNILKILQTRRYVTFGELVADRNDRGRVIGTFLAILELMKEQRITAEQVDDRSDIRIELSGRVP